MTFEYTHSEADVDSSAVYEAYYNDKTRQLAVVLDGGYGYVYKGVPLDVYHTLVGNASPGRYYATTVKPRYGQAEHLGYVGYDNDDEFEEYRGVPAPSMASVTNVNTFVSTPSTSGTPKGLTYAADAVVDGHRVTLAPVPTATVAPKGNETHRFDVEFVVKGSVRHYQTNADTFNDAAAVVEEIGEMLDLEFEVKAVRVVE